MRKRTVKRTHFIIAVTVLGCLAFWIYWGNTALIVKEYEVVSDRIPQGFTGFRIAQVSDLHNAEFGENNSELIDLLSQTDPDSIVITGDLIDSRHTDLDIALTFAGQAAQIAPVYYVTGNHEARVPEYETLKMGLTKAGVNVLDDQKVQISREGEHITLMGIQDPSFCSNDLFGDAESVAQQAITSLQDASDGYTVLLSHRPELFELYVDTGIDLVFSGHAHGGQLRLPFIGGLAAPNQGFFPKYDAGQFIEESITMIVSRGVGNSIIPFRLNNSPEIVVAELNAT